MNKKLCLLLVFILSFNTIIYGNGYNSDKEVMELNSDIVTTIENDTVLEFTSEDLNFSKFANFKVGEDSVHKFFAFYGKWLKLYRPIDDFTSSGIFYGDKDENGYNNFTILIDVDRPTEIVREVFFTELNKKENNAVMKTHRNITIGSTVKEMYDAYGEECEVNFVDNPNATLVNFVYSFTTENDIKAKFIFYTKIVDNLELGDCKINGIRLLIE